MRTRAHQLKPNAVSPDGRRNSPARAAAALLLCGTLALAGCAGAGQSPVQEQQGRAAILDGCASVEVPEGWEWEYLDWPSLGEAGYPEDAFLRVYDPAGGYYDDPREASGKLPRVAVYLSTADVTDNGEEYLDKLSAIFEKMGPFISVEKTEKSGTPGFKKQIVDQGLQQCGYQTYLPTTSGPDIIVTAIGTLYSAEERERYTDEVEEIVDSVQLSPPYEGHVGEGWYVAKLETTQPSLPEGE